MNGHHELRSRVAELEAARAALERELGTSDPVSIVGMVRSLEAQLADLYATWGDREPLSEPSMLAVIEKVRELSMSLDPLYTEKTLTVELHGGSPNVRATWKDPPHRRTE